MTDPTPNSAAPSVRDRIVAAAVELLHEHGIHALTQARVSELAGVRQSHLTYYFPTRSDLLKQAVVAGTASLLAAIQGPPGESAQSLEDFHETLTAQVADRRVPRMMAGLVVASEEDPTLKPWLERFEADMVDQLVQGFRARGLAPRRAALELFQATVVGALTLDLAASTPASRRRTRAILDAAFARLVADARAVSRPQRAAVARRPLRHAR